jgi:predicted DCC family thiol-disulfide oxidoreductase YuxK
MEHWSRERKVIVISSLVTLLCILLGTIVYMLFVPRIIVSMYRGDSIEILNNIVKNRSARPLETYLLISRIIFSRALVICIGIYLIVVLSFLYRPVLSYLREFFTAATHPLNLTVFRVVFFSTLLANAEDYSWEVSWFSQLPPDLQFPPHGLGWLLTFLPINETWAKISSYLLIVVGYTGMIGFFSRTSALLAAILGFYIIGIPQLYGKVNHYHYMLWFAALLATSRCGDMFSCDAIFAAWKRADLGVIAPPCPSQAYTLPLRFVQLLLGVIYFFPGFWKLWNAGIDWAFSDNLKYHLYLKWIELDGWTPTFRLDFYPILCQLAALSTIAFETSFIFLVFSRKLQYLAILGGIIFHKMTDIFMRIFFLDLIKFYVIFFDWAAIFTRIGSWLYQKDMYLIYDGNCKLCCRTIASIKVFDIFGRVVYVNALDKEAIISHGVAWLDLAALMVDMHVVIDRRAWLGFSAYRALATRIPILWPAWPFLSIWPIPTMAKRIYRYVADSRLCRIAGVSSRPQAAHEEAPQRRVSAVIVLGSLLMVANTLYGITKQGAGWPFACFPTFDALWQEPVATSLEISVQNTAGASIPLEAEELRSEFPPVRFGGLTGRILQTKDPEQLRRRLTALWQFSARHNVSLQHAATIRFYKVTLVTVPERRHENPLQRELIYELQLDLQHQS